MFPHVTCTACRKLYKKRKKIYVKKVSIFSLSKPFEDVDIISTKIGNVSSFTYIQIYYAILYELLVPCHFFECVCSSTKKIDH